MTHFYDESISSFQKYMERGLGRIFDIINNSLDINQYKDIVLYGCLNNISYDFSFEGTRASYIYCLMMNYDDTNYFEERILEKFNENLAYYDFAHLSDMLVLLYKESENQKTKNRLEEIYKTIITKEKLDAADVAKLEYLCLNLKHIGGIKRVKEIILDLDKMIPKSFEFSDLGWFASVIYDKYKTINEYIELNCKNIKNADYVVDHILSRKKEEIVTSDHLINIMKSNEDDFHFDYIFSHRASEEEKQKVVDYYFQEQNNDMKKKLLELMSRGGYPIEFEKIVHDFYISSIDLKQLILEVIVTIKNRKIKEFGYTLLDNEQFCFSGIEMICKYYSSKDNDTLVKYTKTLKVSYEDYKWHSAFISIKNIFKRKRRNPPNELLYYIYENTLCSQCREHMVRLMKKHRLLTTEIIEECLNDSNNEIIKYAKRIKRNLKKKDVSLSS